MKNDFSYTLNAKAKGPGGSSSRQPPPAAKLCYTACLFVEQLDHGPNSVR